MRVLDGLEAIPRPLKAAAGLGAFDGIHRGHRTILEGVVAAARREGAAALAVTFDPHPLAVVAPERRPPRIQTPGQKLDALRSCGLDAVLVLSFTPDLAALSGEEFVRRLVSSGLALTSLHVGRRFRFGKDRGGDLALLERLGREIGFAVAGVPEVRVGDEVASSSAVRRLVADGDVAGAAALLGRPFEVVGTIVRGEGRGATLGVPTANLEPENELLPRAGVYVTSCDVAGTRHPGVTNVGTRPTFGGTRLTVETHLLGFDGDLYGERAGVSFLDRLRDERRFSGPHELAAQIARDREGAEAWHRRAAEGRSR